MITLFLTGILLLSQVSIPKESLTLETISPRILTHESYYSENGYHEYLGEEKYRYSTQLGMSNIYDGNQFVPFLWFPENQTIRYQSFSIQFFDWYTIYMNSTHTLIDDMRWQIEYWTGQAGGRWNFLDLYNHILYLGNLLNFVYQQTILHG